MKMQSLVGLTFLVLVAIAPVLSFSLLGAGCTPAKDAWSDDSRAIVGTWRAKCALCHTRVEPGARTAAVFHEALLRHRGRVRLTEPEWTELEAFLAVPAAAPSAPLPVKP
jgi:hypothetical protein